MALNTGAFVGNVFLEARDEAWHGLLVSFSGVGLGGVLAIPSAMQTDVIDHDEWQTGERREGHSVGVWSIARKTAAALGVGTAMFLMEKAGCSSGIPPPCAPGKRPLTPIFR